MNIVTLQIYVLHEFHKSIVDEVEWEQHTLILIISVEKDRDSLKDLNQLIKERDWVCQQQQ